MAVEYILLGLIQHKPRHGYELSREFAAGTALGEIMHLGPSMLYTYLKRLEQVGFVEPTVQPQGYRPPRRVFALTPAGKEELDAWLGAPVSRTRDTRLELLLRLYVAHIHEPALAGKLVSDQRCVVKQFVTSLNQQVAGETDPFRRLVFQLRPAQNQALLGWLDEAGEKLSSP